ncbi:Anaerobic dimethyl sulfoxide reductase chain A [hydrothermal vent metagenome]|uniref:Anaerobic dimethyl sulfoxide reductase chain A n=1 Tax=hydrothermal vent metagenome TaxID=652676 RepID=A0A1W1EFL3_9ZZZZ
MDRRNFMKLSSGVVAASAIPSATVFANDKKLDKDVELIPHASHYGPFKAVVKKGKLIGVQPLEDVDAMPTKMLLDGIVSRTYDDTRIKYPMVRKSYLENVGGDTKRELRGKEEFVRVSWSDALALVSSEISKVIKENGNDSLFSTSYDGWSHSGILRPNVLQGRLFSLLGGHSVTKGDYSAGASQISLPHIIGDMEVYSPQSSWKTIYDNTEVMVFIGSDPVKNSRIEYRVADHQMLPNWYKIKEKGVKFISINPHRTSTSKAMNADWIQIKPNTDTALFLAMSYYAYTNELHDKKYLDKYTVGFDKFLPYLLGKDEDKTPKTPEWAEKITGIPAEKIIELTKLFASKKTQFAPAWSLQRADHGEMPHWAIINFVAILGKIGKVGEGVGFSFHYGNGGTIQSGKSMPVGLAQGKNSVPLFCPASRLTEMLENPNKTFNQNHGEHKYPDVKLIYNSGNNFMSHQQDTNRLIKALNKQVETIVVQDTWWCASARMADIVLPATSTLERNDISSGGTYSNDKIYAMKKAIEPIGESLDDFEIFRRIAYIFDVEKEFTEGKDVMSILKESYEKSSGTMKFEEFWEKGIEKFTAPKEAENFVRHNDFYKDPIKNKLHTTSGKIELYCKDFEGIGESMPPIPKFIEPDEFLGNAKEGEVHVVSPHPNMRLHSQMANANIRSIENIKGRQHILISKEDAASRNIKDEDLIEVYNKRGSLIGGARISDDIMKGVIAIEEGNWLQFDKKGRCNNGSINILTSSKACSELSQATTANSTLASIKKCDDAEPNKAFVPPVTVKIKYDISKIVTNVKGTFKREKSEKNMSEGEKILYRSCSVCHAPPEPSHFTEKQWNGILPSMIPRAGINKKEQSTLREFIKKNAKKN